MANGFSSLGYTGKIENVMLPIAMIIAGFFAIAIFQRARDQLLDLHHLSATCGALFLELIYCFLGHTNPRCWFLLKFFELCSNEWINSTLILIGWYAMVTGQSMVLYSRFHLIVRDKRKI